MYRAKRLLVSLCALLILVPVAATSAATRTGEPATAVAFTAPGGAAVKLAVQQAEPKLICRDLTVGTETLTDDVCGEAPLIDADELTPIVVRTGGLTVVYGTVRARTRSVDLLVDGRRERLRTVAVDGYAPRFYATAFAGTRAVLGGIALRGGTGTVLAAADLERAGLPRAGAPVKVADIEDFARADSELYAVAPRVLADPVKSPRRRVTALCAATGAGDRGLAVQLCATRPRQVEVTYARGCKDAHIVIFGVGPAVVRRAVAVYAAGRTAELDVLRVPPSAGRRGVLMYGSREGKAALKRVRIFNRAGKRLGTVKVQQTRCSD